MENNLEDLNPILKRREAKEAELDRSRTMPRDRLILILRLFLPAVIFIVGIMIIISIHLLPTYPIWQKDVVGGLFIIYAIFRFYQALTRKATR